MRKIFYELGLIFILLVFGIGIGYAISRLFPEDFQIAVPIGMAVGYLTAITVFYFFRRSFSVGKTILLIVLTSFLSAAEFYEVYSTIGTYFYTVSLNYVLLATSLPVLIIINAWFFESIAGKAVAKTE